MLVKKLCEEDDEDCEVNWLIYKNRRVWELRVGLDQREVDACPLLNGRNVFAVKIYSRLMKSFQFSSVWVINYPPMTDLPPSWVITSALFFFFSGYDMIFKASSTWQKRLEIWGTILFFGKELQFCVSKLRPGPRNTVHAEMVGQNHEMKMNPYQDLKKKKNEKAHG